MSLGFILGDATKNHRQVLLEQITNWQAEDPQAKIYYIVPNHNKFSAEVKVLDYLKSQQDNQDLFATSNVQTFSFTRLAWYFMKDTATYQVNRITNAGLNMIVYRSLQEHSDELTIFKGEQTQPGFIAQLVSQLIELQQSCITYDDIERMKENLSQQDTADSAELEAKLHDIAIIYRDFMQMTDSKYLKPADILPSLTQYLQNEDLSNSYFIIEGFSQFTAQEQAIISVLLQRAKEVRIDLILNRGVTDIEDLSDKQSLFYRSERTYYLLYQQARKAQVKILNDVYPQELRVETLELQSLAKYWKESTDLKPINVEKIGDNHNLQVIKADTRMTEIKEIATRIKQMVALKDYRYADFLLLTPDLNKYRNIIEPIFNDYKVPIFVDLAKKMIDHPLVELLTALFNVKAHHYRYVDMMRLLKTELLIPKTEYGYLEIKQFRQDLDLTENLILKFGLEGSQWLRKDDWVYYRFGSSDFGTQTDVQEKITKQVNVIRHYIKEILPPFFKQLDKAENGKEAAQILMNFLITNGVPEQLINWRNKALEQGDMVMADCPEQVWNLFCALMDEYVDTLGDLSFKEEDFLNLLQTGFEGATYRQVPSTLDQVIISETTATQMNDRKVTFIFGATDLVMPNRIQNTMLLTDMDRELVQGTLDDEKYLSDTAEGRMAAEPFMNYLAFMTPRERLYFSYPVAGVNEDGLRMSPYVNRIMKQFDLPLYEANSEPTLEDKKVLKFVATKRTALSNLIGVARQAKGQKQPLPVMWRYVYQKLQEDATYRRLTRKLMAGIEYSNITERLKTEYAEKLYGKTLNTSVSKFEEFFKNHYAFFLKYGLKLKERDVFELSPANTGEFYHMALDKLLKTLKQDKVSIADINKPQLDAYLQQVLGGMEQLPQFQILQSSNRMQFILKQLGATVSQMGWALHNQGQRTKMRPLETEVLFGHVGTENGLKALTYDLGNGHKVNVRGKIDRIDQMIIDNQRYLGIVDYKSSSHKFNYQDAYYGLALQMLTYLNAMLQNTDLLLDLNAGEEIKPAGAVYMHLQNPVIKQKDILKNPYSEVLLKQNKYDGLVLDDQELLSNLDTSIEKAGNSIVYPVRKYADGHFGGVKNSGNVITFDNLMLLLKRNEELIQEAAKLIFAGDVALNPVLWPDRRSALQYSPYKAIMQFDELLGNQYYRLPKENTADILQKLAQENSAESEV